GGDAVAMKSRLSEPPLSYPEFVFARQQPLAKQSSHEGRPVAERFSEMPALCRKHKLDVVGIVEETDGAVAEPQRNEIAGVTSALFQKAQRIPAKLPQVAE